MKKIVVLALVVVALLSSCVPVSDIPVTDSAVQGALLPVSGLPYGAEVIRFRDGDNVCYIYRETDGAGGISCLKGEVNEY